MREKAKLPPEVEAQLPSDLSPLGRTREVTKRLLAVPKDEIDKRQADNSTTLTQARGRDP